MRLTSENWCLDSVSLFLLSITLFQHLVIFCVSDSSFTESQATYTCVSQKL
jgi:hypothetical protein